MNFDALQEFSTIAETRNFTTAAEHLFLTEATLSRRIKKLEEEIGAPLLLRTTRRVELTALGKAFLDFAKRGVIFKGEMDATMNKLLHAEKTQLNIAAINIATEYFSLPSLLTMFNEKYPDITINIHTPNLPIASLLTENVCEMGFAPELFEHEDPNYDRILIRKDKIIAIVPKRHPLLKKNRLSIRDLENERLILISNGSPMFGLCMQACQVNGFQPKVILTMASGNSIRNVVEQGMGIGLLLEYPSTQLHHDYPIGDNVVFCQMDPPVCVNFNLIFSKELSSAAKSFLVFLRNTLKIENL